jgi:integrase
MIASLKAEGREEYHDTICKGLALRVSSGAKAWYLHYRANGIRRRLHLGTYPATGLAAARAAAIEAKGSIEAGESPKPTNPDTLKAIAEEWKARHSELRTIDHRWKAFERLVFPAFGARPIRDIRRSDLVRLLDTVEDERGSQMADQILTYLSALFNWHAARDDDFISPIRRGMRRTKGNARHRILTDDEIRAVWNACDQGPFGRLVRFLLLTAVRRNEAAKAAWTCPSS